MSHAADGFDRIMELGLEEQALLAEGDVVGLGQVLKAREAAISDYLQGDAQTQDERFLDKLLRIRDMNTQLRSEAWALHQTLKEELLRLRSENRRMGGYRNSAIITPLAPRLLNRKG